MFAAKINLTEAVRDRLFPGLTSGSGQKQIEDDSDYEEEKEAVAAVVGQKRSSDFPAPSGSLKKVLGG